MKRLDCKFRKTVRFFECFSNISRKYGCVLKTQIWTHFKTKLGQFGRCVLVSLPVEVWSLLSTRIEPTQHNEVYRLAARHLELSTEVISFLNVLAPRPVGQNCVFLNQVPFCLRWVTMVFIVFPFDYFVHQLLPLPALDFTYNDHSRSRSGNVNHRHSFVFKDLVVHVIKIQNVDVHDDPLLRVSCEYSYVPT